MVANTTLLLDCGNSSIKYQLGTQTGRMRSTESVLELAKTEAVNKVVMASVSAQGPRVKQRLREAGVSCVSIEVRQGWGGLSLCYQNPGQLGVDRWLTLVALCGQKSDVLVIDAGTALTIDLLGSGDQHHGGYILPGLGLMRRSLVDDTFALPEVDDARSIDLGQSTKACIANGTLLAMAATVDAIVRRMNRQPLCVVWTGGDAPNIRPYSECAGQYRPDLMFEGMKRLLADTAYMETLQ